MGENVMKRKIVLVGGPMGSCRKAFAGWLHATRYAAGIVVSLRNYYKEFDGPGEEHNFDEPDSIDFDLLVRDVEKLACGEAVNRLEWDSINNRRVVCDDLIPWREYTRSIIVEGSMALYDDNLRGLADLTVFVDTAPELGIVRQLRYEAGSTRVPFNPLRRLARIERDVIPGYYKYVLPTKKFADFVVNCDDPHAPSKAATLLGDSLYSDAAEFFNTFEKLRGDRDVA